MPPVSRAQQRAAGMALAAKHGKIPMKKLTGSAKSMAKSMSAAQLAEFAHTTATDLPFHKTPANKHRKHRVLGRDE